MRQNEGAFAAHAQRTKNRSNQRLYALRTLRLRTSTHSLALNAYDAWAVASHVALRATSRRGPRPDRGRCSGIRIPRAPERPSRTAGQSAPAGVGVTIRRGGSRATGVDEPRNGLDNDCGLGHCLASNLRSSVPATSRPGEGDTLKRVAAESRTSDESRDLYRATVRDPRRLGRTWTCQAACTRHRVGFG